MKGGSHVLRYFSDPAGGFGHCGSAEKAPPRLLNTPAIRAEGAGESTGASWILLGVGFALAP